MAIELSKEEIASVIPSLQRYLTEELDVELTGLQAQFLLDYFMKEVAPIAYNKGVSDAETYFRSKLEDLPSLCYEPELTYWNKKRK
jgi:uncharacterized protein (DUF2164 family)